MNGEHNVLAARRSGLTEIRCEVQEMDDVQAMRETVTRNKHGTSNKVKRGRTFRAMRENLGSNVAVAEAVGMRGSSGLFLAYADAADARNRYEAGTGDIVIPGLKKEDVKKYLTLPEGQRDTALTWYLARGKWPPVDPQGKRDHRCPACGHQWSGRVDKGRPGQVSALFEPERGGALSGKCEDCAEGGALSS